MAVAAKKVVIEVEGMPGLRNARPRQRKLQTARPAVVRRTGEKKKITVVERKKIAFTWNKTAICLYLEFFFPNIQRSLSIAPICRSLFVTRTA
ncbi:hypothetical protein J4Q44_G00170040 [Coregonus suidteri]|uniref:Uncharacterized protein n=1 Tax=Coregonus suidteri TaxID=861788 RepID=A0AAN8LHD4_9TELE